MDAPPQPSQTHPETQTSIYTSLSAYPFSTDADFLSGLSSILGHPETPPTTEEIDHNQDLVLQAQCFYFTRKFGTPIDVADYKAYLASSAHPDQPTPSHLVRPQEQAQQPLPPNGTQSENAHGINAQSTQEIPAQPPYPPTFADIVDLITANKPIPGIETIPDTVLEHGSSKVDHTTRRRKPWETNAATAVDSDIFGNGGTVRENGSKQENQNQAVAGSAAATERSKRPTEGVLKILQPDAYPDSGLIAKD